MKKIITILIFVTIVCGCSTRFARIKCTNVQTVSGFISNVEIDKRTWEDDVTIEFVDGRIKKFVVRHDMAFILQYGRHYSIGYSGDNNVVFWVTLNNLPKFEKINDFKKSI